MKLIKCLIAQMHDEIEGVKEYSIMALEYRTSRPELARLYHTMAEQEYEHYNKLHEWAVRIKDEAESSGINFPQKMSNKWEEEHRKCIEDIGEAKVSLNMYR